MRPEETKLPKDANFRIFTEFIAETYAKNLHQKQISVSCALLNVFRPCWNTLRILFLQACKCLPRTHTWVPRIVSETVMMATENGVLIRAHHILFYISLCCMKSLVSEVEWTNIRVHLFFDTPNGMYSSNTPILRTPEWINRIIHFRKGPSE